MLYVWRFWMAKYIGWGWAMRNCLWFDEDRCKKAVLTRTRDGQPATCIACSYTFDTSINKFTASSWRRVYLIWPPAAGIIQQMHLLLVPSNPLSSLQPCKHSCILDQPQGFIKSWKIVQGRDKGQRSPVMLWGQLLGNKAFLHPGTTTKGGMNWLSLQWTLAEGANHVQGIARIAINMTSSSWCCCSTGSFHCRWVTFLRITTT